MLTPDNVHVNAASQSEGNLILFFNTQYVTYEVKLLNPGGGRVFLTPEFKQVGFIRDLWPNAYFINEDQGIEAASRRGDNSVMLWFIDGFMFEANAAGGLVSGVQLPQNRLFKCSDETINKYLGNLMGITNFDEYSKFEMQFVPKDEDRILAENATPIAPSGDKAASTNSRRIGYIAFGVFVGIIVLVAIIAALLNSRRGRGLFGLSSSSKRSSSRRRSAEPEVST